MDPGHPFSVPYEQLIADLEDRIRHGVEQPDRARFNFQSQRSSYELPREAYAIARVTGLRANAFTVFQPGLHYRFANNRILWIHASERPDEGSRFEVEYTYRERPAGLTDFNPGSVIGTLIRAVAREVKLLYEQMDEAYRRAFIDVATGVALDNVVALLGVSRRPATRAHGTVTFFRNTPADRDVTIPAGTRVTDESERQFVTTAAAILVAEASEFVDMAERRLRVTDQIAELVGVWRRQDDPASAPPLATQTTPGLHLGDDGRTVTLPDTAPPSGPVRVRYKPRSVRVPVEAAQPGPEGNVNAGAVVIMPTPPPGIDGVVNEAPIDGGQVAEADDPLRERARHALEEAGNATLNALKYAVLGRPGVEGVEVVDYSVDDTIPLGEVRVRVSGGDPQDIQRVVDETRAAGILARLEVIDTILVAGTFYVIPEPDAPAAAASSFLAQVVEALEAQTIGQALSVRRLNALVYQVNGLADVAEAQLTCKNAAVPDPLFIAPTELIRPDKTNLRVVVLDALRAQRQAGTKLGLEIWLADVDGNPVRFDNLSLDVVVTLRATSATVANQVERVGRFTTTVRFVDIAVATLTIDPAAHAPQFRAADHQPDVRVVLNAAAYAGLKPVDESAEVTVDFSP